MKYILFFLSFFTFSYNLFAAEDERQRARVSVKPKTVLIEKTAIGPVESGDIPESR